MARRPKQEKQQKKPSSLKEKKRKDRPRRRHSIRSKITLCLMAIISFMILLTGIISVTFIKRYYYSRLKK